MKPAAFEGTAVNCDGIWKTFGDGPGRIEVLRDVDFRAQVGELTFIVGPSSSGKTTLLSVIAGLLKPNRGEVEVLGCNLTQLSDSDRVKFRRQNLGFVFQNCLLLPALTATENAAVPLLAAGARRADALERAAALLEQLGLKERLHAFPPKLSGGEQQRVALARALVHSPRLVICDEPTAALDHAKGEAVIQMLANAALHGDRAVIVVTHDTRVFHFADAIARLDDGQIVEVRAVTKIRL